MKATDPAGTGPVGPQRREGWAGHGALLGLTQEVLSAWM